MMEDKDVGELWAQANDDQQRPYGTDGRAIVISLILKLIEERAMRLYRQADHSYGFVYACEDFGIDYAEYLKAKEQP